LSPPRNSARPGQRRWLAFALLLLGLWATEPLTATAETRTPAKPAARSSKAKPAAKTPAKKKPAAQKPKQKKSRSAAGATQRDLVRLQEEIRSAEKRLQLTREQREQKEAELRQAEIEIGALKSNVQTVRQEVSGREERLRALQAEKALRQQERDRLVNLIRADLQMAQRQGSQDYYKLLLNQENPQTLSRLMKYYGYMQQARGGRVQSLNATLARLDSIAREEQEGVMKLRTLRGDLEHKQNRLSAAQTQRTQAIRTLSAQLESDDEKLQRLRRDERALQSVMDRLAREAEVIEQRAREQREQDRRDAEKRRQEGRTAPPVADGRSADKPAPPLPPEEPRDVKLVPYKGRCPLPVAGGLRARFGESREGGLRWNGILIGAGAGTPVRAIRPGRVAFADYLRGYGLLLIIDHGRGLMSLYGHNQALQKKAGETVGGNEVIATVGDSGGNETDGLYFEIRVRGRPSDPASWCAYR
jgi:septal ring factor EnvC (AmiA/AmiB activator)